MKARLRVIEGETLQKLVARIHNVKAETVITAHLRTGVMRRQGRCEEPERKTAAVEVAESAINSSRTTGPDQSHGFSKTRNCKKNPGPFMQTRIPLAKSATRSQGPNIAPL